MTLKLKDLSLKERMELYDKAMELREKEGWGKRKIAKEIGTYPSIVSKWLYQGSKPDTGTVVDKKESVEIESHPLEERMNLYNRAVELRNEKRWGGRRIGAKIGVSFSTVENWIYQGHKPDGAYRLPDFERIEELAYVNGVCRSDGCICSNGVKIYLSVRDRDFAEEFSRCLSIILNRQYDVKEKERKDREGVMHEVCISNRLLYEYLDKPLEEQSEVDEAPSSFLRALYDGDGTFSGHTVSLYSSNLGLLDWVEETLYDKYSIEAHRRLHTSAGKTSNILGDPITLGKDLWQLFVSYRDGVERFCRKIGFTIFRKQKKMKRYLEN